MSTDRSCDVLVVGAGPAGSRAARDLALRGFDVVLIEQHREVGLPCHCSGLVSPSTLDLADVGRDIVLNAVRGAIIHFPDGDSVRLGGERVHAYVIDRPELDRRLVRQAVEAGAQLLSQTHYIDHVVDPADPQGNAVRAQVLAMGRRTELTTRLLVGADGAHSKIARRIAGRPAPTVAAIGLAALYEPTDQGADYVEVFIHPAAAPGWFGWSIPTGGGRARVGTGSVNGIRPLESFARLQQIFAESLGTARATSPSGGSIPIWEPARIVGDRVVLVGDAARQVKPISGGGIRAALQAAAIAADVCSQQLRTGRLDAGSLAEYPARWGAIFGQELRRQHDMRRAMLKLTLSDYKVLHGVLSDPAVRHCIERAADIDFVSRIVWPLLSHQPAMVLRLITTPRYPRAWISAALRGFRAGLQGRTSDRPVGPI